MRAILPILAIVGGCSIGPSLRDYAPARHAAGDIGTFHLSTGSIRGELLAIDPAGFFVLSAGKVIRIPVERVQRARFEHSKKRMDRSQPQVPADLLLALPPFSRFPAGIPESAMAILLARAHQAEPEIAGG